MRLKTAPRVILGLAVVGALAYGVNYYIDHRPKTPAPTVDQLATQPQPPVVVQQTDVLPPVQPAPQPAPVAAAPQPAPVQQPARTQSDAALNALINGGKK